MPDPLLFDLMHGVNPLKKGINDKLNFKSIDRFESALDQEIEAHVDSLLESDPFPDNKLITPAMRRMKLEQQVRESLDFTEFGQKISLGVSILRIGCEQQLEKEEYDALIRSLDELKERLSSLNLRELENETLQEALRVPAQCGPYILKIGINKFVQGLIAESLALFLFLTLVNPGDPDYWFRLGLVAKKTENYPLALSALETTSELAPEFIGAYVYAAYCHMKMDERECALAGLAKAKELLKTTQGEEEWQEHISNLEILLA
jgi:tetratricopeptide (TPR) repeat protein